MNIVVLDLPLPLEPVEVDLDVPLEKQLAGIYLEEARTMLAKINDIHHS